MALQLRVKGRYAEILVMLCTKCGERERVEGQRWCRQCFTIYQSGWYRLSRERLATRSKKEGIAIMRRELAARFQKIGLDMINGVTAAEIVRRIEVDV
jgi:hypothetical protein